MSSEQDFLQMWLLANLIANAKVRLLANVTRQECSTYVSFSSRKGQDFKFKDKPPAISHRWVFLVKCSSSAHAQFSSIIKSRFIDKSIDLDDKIPRNKSQVFPTQITKRNNSWKTNWHTLGTMNVPLTVTSNVACYFASSYWTCRKHGARERRCCT